MRGNPRSASTTVTSSTGSGDAQGSQIWAPSRWPQLSRPTRRCAPSGSRPRHPRLLLIHQSTHSLTNCGIGDPGGIALGEALTVNRAIVTMYMEYVGQRAGSREASSAHTSRQPRWLVWRRRAGSGHGQGVWRSFEDERCHASATVRPAPSPPRRWRPRTPSAVCTAAHSAMRAQSR